MFPSSFTTLWNEWEFDNIARDVIVALTYCVALLYAHSPLYDEKFMWGDWLWAHDKFVLKAYGEVDV
jgi:hypothetical protein